MTCTLITSTPLDKCIKEENQGKVAIGSLAFDAIAGITLLVVGILGAVSVVGMPPAAAYTMIAIGSTILAADIIRIALGCICDI